MVWPITPAVDRNVAEVSRLGTGPNAMTRRIVPAFTVRPAPGKTGLVFVGVLPLIS